MFVNHIQLDPRARVAHATTTAWPTATVTTTAGMPSVGLPEHNDSGVSKATSTLFSIVPLVFRSSNPPPRASCDVLYDWGTTTRGVEPATPNHGTTAEYY